MNYYEELAIEPAASRDEILKSYKRLTRILHPDLHSDAALRALGEAQMRRLNEIIDILSDPARRRLYDRGIVGLSRNTQTKWFQLRTAIATIPHWIYVSAGFLLGLVVSYIPHPPAAGTSPFVPEAVSPAAEARGLSEAPAPAASRPGRRRRQPSETEDGKAALPEAIDSGPVTPAPEPETAAAPGAIASPPEARQTADGNSSGGYGGSWLYTPPRTGALNAALYSPEYIEMRISEREGAMEGRYAARYHIPDKPISPSVAFQFAGRSGGPQSTFAWTDHQGLRGEVRLRLLGESSMQVTWYVTGAVPPDGLGGGTAVLVRREE